MVASRPSVVHGTRPGSLGSEVVREVQVERRLIQAAVDQEARRRNRAYGSLNLDLWNEGTTHSPNPIVAPRRRKKKS